MQCIQHRWKLVSRSTFRKDIAYQEFGESPPPRLEIGKCEAVKRQWKKPVVWGGLGKYRGRETERAAESECAKGRPAPVRAVRERGIVRAKEEKTRAEGRPSSGWLEKKREDRRRRRRRKRSVESKYLDTQNA